jgi:hypothetical protein
MAACKKEYSELDPNSLNWFESKVCMNKRSILSSIAIMFIFTIITGMVKKKLNKRKNKPKPQTINQSQAK